MKVFLSVAIFIALFCYSVSSEEIVSNREDDEELSDEG